MPRPATLTDAIALVRKSGLLEDGAVKEFVARTRRKGIRGLSIEELLGAMAQEGLLTPFQARQLAEGRWRGLVLGNYRLKARIGKGGMGQVYLGEHRQLRRPVAIKVLNAALSNDAIAKARLVREARATAALDHPNIVKVFDIDADHSPPYMVMEHVDGVSLQAVVALTGTFRTEAAALCGRQIASGLAHAAEAGLVHRDIKPANLLLDRFGLVKILDLGIVLLQEDSKLTLRIDGQSPILGTLDYLAPEQAVDSHAVDARADIYALGGTLYFLLAGQPPFAETPPVSRLRRKQSEDPPPIHTLRPDVPEELSAVISKMLARRPHDRFDHAGEVAAALVPWARPLAGFPEDLFAQIHPEDGDRESTAKPRTGFQPYLNPALIGLQANGSSIHAALLVQPTSVDLSASSVATPRPQSLLTRPVPALPPTPPSKPKRGRSLVARRLSRYWIVLIGVGVVGILAILGFWFGWLELRLPKGSTGRQHPSPEEPFPRAPDSSLN